MPENKILLVNLDYPDNDHDHIMYSVPEDRLEEAQAAVSAGCETWLSIGAGDPRTIEECIDQALKAANVPAKGVEFESMDVDCDC